MKVPLLDLKAQYRSIQDEVQEALHKVLESQRFVLGPEVEALEEEVAAYCQCAYGVGVSSGTDALLVSLMALGIGPGDEIVTSPYTFFATAGAISRLGARPVFVDIDPATYNIDPAQIEAALSESTRAIIPVHLFGQMADMDPILKIAAAHELVVIEDAAQAIGAEYRGRRAGSLGQLGCFSFFPSKNLGGMGDGGLVTTSDPQLADRLRLLRNHGYSPKYYSKVVGGNFRLDAIQAAVLRVKLKHLPAWTERRRENARIYRELFEGAGESPGERGIGVPVELPECHHVYNQFVIQVERRDGLLRQLQKAGIGCEVYYPLALHLQECFAALGHAAGDFPASERAAARSLAIPIYPELSSQQIGAVADQVIRHPTAK